jgi:hypothetical protein
MKIHRIVHFELFYDKCQVIKIIYSQLLKYILLKVIVKVKRLPIEEDYLFLT